jgi:hypothetical protein
MPIPHSNIHAVQGLWCAMLTPIGRDGGVDRERFAQHAKWLLAQGVDGVAPFGTTGEGQSFSMAERADGLAALLKADVPPERVVAATGCAALTETIALTRESVQSRCAACLVLPPFFFKGMSDDGLFAWYARLIEAVADPRLRVLLYHIPQVSGVGLSVDLVARLAAAFPGVVAGVKDSAGDWAHTSALVERVPSLGILVGHEPHLPAPPARGRRRDDLRHREPVSRVRQGIAVAIRHGEGRRTHRQVHRGCVHVSVPAGVQGDCRCAHRRSRLARGSPAVPPLFPMTIGARFSMR